MDRREFTTAIGLGAASAMLPAGAAAADATFHIGMLLFEGMTYLDFAGPQDGLTKLRNGKVHAIAKSRGVREFHGV